MRIGIITLTGFFNYGNRLQNYALSHFLEKIINDVQVDTIWYDKDNYNVNNFSLIRTLRYCLLNKHGVRDKIKNKTYIYDYIREYNMKRFNDQYLNLIYSYDVDSSFNERYDYFIVGSDQVWYPSKKPRTKEFLQFADKNKRVSYAASFGVNSIPSKMYSSYKDFLNGMHAISVREESGVKIVKEITGKNAKLLVDPTLLLTRKEWMQIAKRPYWMKENSKYILLYILGELNSVIKEFLKSFADENNYTIIDMMDESNGEIYASSPDEFIYLIAHAQIVITDSFHGTVFSIINNVPFFVYPRKGITYNADSRINTVLDMFGLERQKRNVTEIFNDKDIIDVSFENVEKILNIKRNESENWLKNALGGTLNDNKQSE